MISISVKKAVWLVAVLLALAGAFVLASEKIQQLYRAFIAGESALVAIEPQKIAVDETSPETDAGIEGSGSGDSFGEITRTFYKPSHSKPEDSVRLEISAVEQKSELLIVGKLSDGSSCTRLQIELELQADDGRKIFHTLILGGTGMAGARPIQSKRRLAPASTESPTAWKAHVVSLRCLDP